MNIWPVLVPSKGRFNSIFLRRQKNCTVFVEPQDVDGYTSIFGNRHKIVNIGQTNQGIVFVRNFIKRYATDNSYRWYWQIDDDVSQFHFVANKRNKHASMEEALSFAQSVISSVPNAGIGSLEYKHLIWVAKKPMVVNSCLAEVCVAINTEKTKDVWYDQDVAMVEDRDFVISARLAGLNVVKVCGAGFASPKTGSNQGGLYDQYANNADQKAILALKNKWGELIEIVEKSGKKNLKIRYDKINSLLLRQKSQ